MDLEAVARAVGVKRVRTVDPLNLKEVNQAIREEVAALEPSVIIAKRPCVLLKESVISEPVEVMRNFVLIVASA